MKISIDELRKQILEFHYKRDRLVYQSSVLTIDTKLSKSDMFLKSNLYTDIVDSTDFLPSDVTIYHRIKAILDGYDSIPICHVCGHRKLKINKNFKRKLFREDCGSVECITKNMTSHIKPQDENLKFKHWINVKRFRNKIRDLQMKIYEKYVKSNYSLMSYDEIREMILERKNNQKHSSSLIRNEEYENNHDFICSVIYHTRFIKTKNESEDLTNNFFKFTERTYCIFHEIKEYKRCEVCGEQITTFDKNWNIGYRSVCSNPVCGTEKASKHRVEKNMKLFKEKIKEHGYELISGNTNRDGRGILRHSCGTKFETDLRSLFLFSKKPNKNKFRNFDMLCPKCFPRENLVSKWEIEVRNFCSDICKEDKFTFNDRKTLCPYEIDILNNTKNIGIECDGAAMHSDDKKSDRIHKWKTDECEKQGIELMHFIDHEWYLNQETIKSIIMRKMKLYDIVKNVECDEKYITHDECRKFFDNNNLLKFENMTYNIGIYNNGIIIGCYSYDVNELGVKVGNITIRNGYNIENIIKFICDRFPDKKITIFEDMRLFLFKNKLEENGFSIERRTKSRCLKINRILNHRAHDRYFDGQINNEKNIYDVKGLKNEMIIRYFDCGNLVYTKRYE